MKAKCRFCHKVVGVRNRADIVGGKTPQVKHKCPHGVECLTSTKMGSGAGGSNQASIWVGNPPQRAAGCPICDIQRQLMEYPDRPIARYLIEWMRNHFKSTED